MIGRKHTEHIGSAERGLTPKISKDSQCRAGNEKKSQAMGALGTAAVSLAGAMVVTGGVTAAHASTSCDYRSVLINDSPGGDRVQLAYGHSHRTGNHFISGSTWDNPKGKHKWYWFADNDGGSDGGTGDTFYGYSWCSNSAPAEFSSSS
ncbi:hypothetical protein ACWDOR_18705 [Streptosporangium canum]